MRKAFKATVNRTHHCPIDFNPGNQMALALPEVSAEDSDQVCALALVDLIPIVHRLDRLVDLGRQGEVEGIHCTGCKARGAHVEFRVEYDESGLGQLDDKVVQQRVQILKYHVVAGRVVSPDAIAAKKAPTLAKQEIRIMAKGGQVMINDAKVVAADIDAKNGVIHVVDSVLLPR